MLSETGAASLGEDFPIICEKCLGPNPYVRMLKAEKGKECRISGAPFTAFRWQGEHKRWKETIVSALAAREKNCCQACLNDLEYAVPFHVRDHIMDALGEDETPRSDVTSQFYWANKRKRQEEDGEDGGDTYEKLKNNVEKLREYAALNPGPVVLPRRDAPLTPEEQEKLRQKRQAELRPPADPTITSLYVGGIPPSVTTKDMLPYFLAYGEVKDIALSSGKLSAIVTYNRRSDAETACKAMSQGMLTIKGTRTRVMWARRKKNSADSAASASSIHAHYGTSAVPPPGISTGISKSAGAGAPRPTARVPPGIKSAVATSYPSMNPDVSGALPERE